MAKTKNADGTITDHGPQSAKVQNPAPPKAKDEAKPKAKAQPKPKPLKECSCGCGGLTKSKWVPGHDARLWGVAHKVKSGRLDLDEAKVALAAFPAATVKAHADRVNTIADCDLTGLVA